MKINIGQAAKALGVSQETLRRWERTGKIEVERTPNGRHRYDLTKLKGSPFKIAKSNDKNLKMFHHCSTQKKGILTV